MALTEPSVFPTKQHHEHVAGERCPWCDQPIPHEKFDEIQARIQIKERQRSAEAERQLKAELHRQKADSEAKAKADIERVCKEAVAAAKKAQQEAATREAEARKQGKKAAETALIAKMAEALEAKDAAEAQVKTLKAEKEAELNSRLQQQREAMEKANTGALNAERAKAFADRQKLETQLQNMQRKLQKQTAGELGEGAEIDVYEALREAFEDDRIKRVDKGVPGADIIHDVMHNGQMCGRIVYDSKNRSAWRNDYVAKLRQDRLAAHADHAVLPSRVFPAGTRQLHFQDGVVIVNPARLVPLVAMLRKHVIQTHTLRLSAQDRDEKTAALYDFINSERCVQLFERIETLTDNMLDLEVKEKKTHDATWRRRGELIKSVQKAHGDITTEIDKIVAAGGGNG